MTEQDSNQQANDPFGKFIDGMSLDDLAAGDPVNNVSPLSLNDVLSQVAGEMGISHITVQAIGPDGEVIDLGGIPAGLPEIFNAALNCKVTNELPGITREGDIETADDPEFFGLLCATVIEGEAYYVRARRYTDQDGNETEAPLMAVKINVHDVVQAVDDGALSYEFAEQWVEGMIAMAHAQFEHTMRCNCSKTAGAALWFAANIDEVIVSSFAPTRYQQFSHLIHELADVARGMATMLASKDPVGPDNDPHRPGQYQEGTSIPKDQPND